MWNMKQTGRDLWTHKEEVHRGSIWRQVPVDWDESRAFFYWRCPRSCTPLRVWSANKMPISCATVGARFNFRPITSSPCANTPAAANASPFVSFPLRACLALRRPPRLYRSLNVKRRRIFITFSFLQPTKQISTSAVCWQEVRSRVAVRRAAVTRN